MGRLWLFLGGTAIGVMLWLPFYTFFGFGLDSLVGVPVGALMATIFMKRKD